MLRCNSCKENERTIIIIFLQCHVIQILLHLFLFTQEESCIVRESELLFLQYTVILQLCYNLGREILFYRDRKIRHFEDGYAVHRLRNTEHGILNGHGLYIRII